MAAEQRYTNLVDIAKDYHGGSQYLPLWVIELFKSEYTITVL